MGRCKGLIFKFQQGTYVDKKKNTVSTKKSMILLKRESCQDGNHICKDCSEVLDIFLSHDFSFESSPARDSMCETKKYKLIAYIDNSYDCEGGYYECGLDDYYFEEYKR